jgi:mRNA-degrading endonuclease YafQ of YafQ-DinJ toxin-antitoxin module
MLIKWSNGVSFWQKGFVEVEEDTKKRQSTIWLVNKHLELFLIDENHPSLRKHKLRGDLQDCWSISVNMGIRMVYYKFDNKVFFIKIGTHDKVYEAN